MHTHPFFTRPPYHLLMWFDDCSYWSRNRAHCSVPCWPATSLPTQMPGFGCNLAPHITARLWCLQALFCVQTTQMRAPLHGLCSLCQGQTFPSNTPLDTFSKCRLEARCSHVTPEAEAMDMCLCTNPALETAPPWELRAQPSALRFQVPNLRGSNLNDQLQGLRFWRRSFIDPQATSDSEHYPQGLGWRS